MKAEVKADPNDPIVVFILSFCVASLAGIATLLRTEQVITVRSVFTTIANSGALGLGIAFVLFHYFQENTWFLMGLCMFAGLGGVTAMGFVAMMFQALFRRGGIQINVKVKPAEEEDSDDE